MPISILFLSLSSQSMSKKKSNPVEEDELDLTTLPPKPLLDKLINQIELQLPKEDHVKYDSRAKKLDWNKIAWEEMNAEDCQKNWEIIQVRIKNRASHWLGKAKLIGSLLVGLCDFQ